MTERMDRERERETRQRRRERERLCVKWSSQVAFETDLPRGAANAFSVYMSVHAAVSDCVSVPVLLGCSFT